ncbi:Uncharacterized protein TCAP_06664 [Tolypocladium capitatum]|uniref:Xaa-Pro dipeptidyl-peptidase C-terminal domain-containing protein n=1 Tax=Tolypocladium capitatum TaxID=45235 RepID=A0A2K3Q794_9HYPO|nr:Uncharacterized protein TCAP_06664 [Tolypocladium capitatum]
MSSAATEHPPILRSYASAALDRLAGWFFALPPERSAYTLRPLTIPLPDGVSLAADLYWPDGALPQPLGLVLVQGCYGRAAPFSFTVRVLAARGYAVLFVSTRGTFGSGGGLDPGRSEKADAQEVVRWMRQQSWYPGQFATAGASYLSYTQWALLHDPPEDCIASAIIAGPHDYARHHWGTGSFRMDRITWSDALVRQEDAAATRLYSAVSQAIFGASDIDNVLMGLPVAERVKEHFGDEAPWLPKAMSAPDVCDPYWAPTRHQMALDKATAPILLVSGWYDPFAAQTLEQYVRLRERGCSAALTVGPWTHVQAAGLKCMPDMIRFLDEHVARTAADGEMHRGRAARIFVTGAEEWREMSAWPPATTSHELYLHGDKSLTTERPPVDAAPSSFTYDPADPTPTIGGVQLSNGGRVDDSIYASRTDLLVFTGSLVEEEIEVLGKPAIRLAHSSDIPFVDLWIRLSEVNTAGVSHNICDAFQALDPERDPSAPVQLTLQDCAHVFRRGTRIRLIIAGGSFPLFARNLGTEGNRTVGSEMRAARHTIQHMAGSTKLVLPVAADGGDPTGAS